MTAPLDALQVKIQTQLLQATFLKNMMFLKQHMPAIYEYYQNYTPKKIQLAIDNKGAINLATNNQFVYPDDPKQESLKQVDAFLQKPPSFDFEITMTDEKTHQYEHEKVLNRIFTKRFEDLSKFAPYALASGEQINFIAFMGSGLGHHIEQLFTQYAVRSMFIFEPEPDVFFATLHSVEIDRWFETCKALGGELTLKIGGGEDVFVNDVYQYFKREGYFNLPQMYLYRHYKSDKTNDAFKRINDLAYRYKSGWGFCEDEIIGISHTLSNISDNNAATLLAHIKPCKKNFPVFIIGNGPSLDENLQYIKENQDNVVLISSGTSLKPLLNYGITPDIHVEQERPQGIYQWVKKIGYEEQLKTIPLICLNTVYPGILALFKRPYVMLKAGDAGTSFIHEYVSDKYSELFFCNPTVTNASSAGAIAMGFNKLYLFGLDYGFKSEQEHHAKGSIYQDIQDFTMSGDFKVPGNFGGEVHTMRVFDSSRGVLEMLLENNPKVKCVNASDGAAIKLTTPSRFDALPKFKKIKNKKVVVEDYLTRSFDNSYSIKHDLYAEFSAVLPHFTQYIDFLIKQLATVTTKNELTDAFAIQFKFMNQHENERSRKLFHRFFSGSLNYLQAGIMNNVARYANKQKQQDYIQYCINEMQQHLLFLLDDVSEHYNKAARA